MARTLPTAANVRANGDIKLRLDITPTGQESTFEDMTRIFESSTYAMNEVVQQIAFLCDNGFGSSFVSGAAPTLALSGRYVKNNALCEYLADIEYKIGEERVTNYEIEKFGKRITGSCTITQLNIGGGSGTDGAPISMTLAFNGKPTVSVVSEPSPANYE